MFRDIAMFFENSVGYVVLILLGVAVYMIVKKVKKFKIDTKNKKLQPLIAKYRNNPLVIEEAKALAACMESRVTFNNRQAYYNKHTQREITAEWTVEGIFGLEVYGNKTPCCNRISGDGVRIDFMQRNMRPIYDITEMHAFMHAIVSRGIEFFAQAVPKDPSSTDYEINIREEKYTSTKDKRFKIHIKYTAPNGYYINPENMKKW